MDRSAAPDPLGRGLSDDRSEGPSSFIKKRRRQIGRLARAGVRFSPGGAAGVTSPQPSHRPRSMIGPRSPDPQTPVLYAAIPADSRTELDSSQKSIAPRFAWSVMTAAARKSSAPSEGLLLDGRLNHTSKQVIGMLGSRKLFQRARRACWLVPLVSSRDNLFSSPQVLALQRRLEAGDLPPLLPSEVKQRSLASSALLIHAAAKRRNVRVKALAA